MLAVVAMSYEEEASQNRMVGHHNQSQLLSAQNYEKIRTLTLGNYIFLG
jgi:hypothetical protein